MAQAPFNPPARNQVFNIGAETPYTVNELAKQVAKAMGVSPNVKYLDARNEVKHAFSNHRRLEEVFGYKAKVLFGSRSREDGAVGPCGRGKAEQAF